MVRTYNLSKKFGTIYAVKDLNLDIKRGEFFCFLGPNGAGKTTTIRMLVGLLTPSQGKIFIAGKDMDKNSLEIKRIIGYVPDEPFLYENLTPEEFLEFIIKIYALDSSRAHREIEEYLELLRLSALRDVLIREFSHGMKQRLVYISNLIRHPQVFFIDEPLVGLDPYSIRIIKEILRDFVKKGNTVFMSTHILSIAQDLSTSIGIIDKARLIAQGKIEELLEYKTQGLEEIFFKLTEEGNG